MLDSAQSGDFGIRKVERACQLVSNQLLRVEEGSLYPALHRMEQNGWLLADWGKTDKNRDARFYSRLAGGICGWFSFGAFPESRADALVDAGFDDVAGHSCIGSFS